MNCDGVSDLLSAYLDGELLPGELLRVEQHLRRCHACADSVTSLRQTIALVASLEEVQVPANFHAQLRSRLLAVGSPVAARHKFAAASWYRNVRTWAIPAAAAAAALAFIWSNPQPGLLPGLTAGSEMVAPAPKVAFGGESPTGVGGTIPHGTIDTPPDIAKGTDTNPIDGGIVPPIGIKVPPVAPVDPPKSGVGPGTGGTVVTGVPGTGTVPLTPVPTPVYSYTTTIVIATENSDKLVQSLKQPSWNPMVTTEGVLILKVASDSYAPTLEAVKRIVGSTAIVSTTKTDRASQILQLTTELKAVEIDLANFANSNAGVLDDEYTKRLNEKRKIVTDIRDKLGVVQDEVLFGRINVQFKPAH